MNAKQVADLLAALTPADVMQAYEGERDRCYCGCSGQYYYNSQHVQAAAKDRGYEVSPEDVNDEMVAEILETVQSYFDADDKDSYNIQGEAGGFVTHFTAVDGGESYTVYLCPKV